MLNAGRLNATSLQDNSSAIEEIHISFVHLFSTVGVVPESGSIKVCRRSRKPCIGCVEVTFIDRVRRVHHGRDPHVHAMVVRSTHFVEFKWSKSAENESGAASKVVKT